MRLKISPTQKLFLIIFLVSTVPPTILFYSIPQDPTQNAEVSLQGQEKVPVRLRIPAINVNAAVAAVGLAPDGAMDVPKDPDSVAWFDLGQHPGENGTAVIAGHFGWKDDIPAVFDNLHALHRGDRLLVEDGTGTTTAFVVRELRTYGQNENASEVFSSSDGKAHLNLITCGGAWNEAQKSYSSRLVVFTDKEIAPPLRPSKIAKTP